MAHNHNVKCTTCKAVIAVIERPMGVPGGKEREEALCPICGSELYSAMTDGWFFTSIVSTSDLKEEYKDRIK